MNGSFARAGLKHRESFTYQNPGMALAAIELIDDVIEITSEGHVILEQLMDTVLGIFSASRAWLFYPCNPNLPSFEVSFESTAPEYPGAKALAQKVPMTADMADYCRRALSAKNGPEIDPPEGKPVKNDIAIRFDVKSMLFMALRPKSGEPWMFGIHQCDRDRIWTDDEKKLFYMIGQRTTGCIDNLLYVRQLQESEERFRAIFENINDAVFIHKILSNGEPGNFLLFNRAAIKMSGYSSGELRSMSPRELDDPDASSQYIPGVMAQLKTRKSSTFEAVQRAKDGRKIDIEVNAVVADIGGQDFIVSVCRDITEKKAFQKELLEKEQFLSAIYKGVSHSIFVVDVLDDGGFKYAGLNPQHEKITGVSDDFIQGKTPEEVLPKGNALAVCRRYADCVNRKQILKYEEWLPFKGKQTCWETTLHPQMSSSGQVYRIIGTSQEITERKTAETLLERVRYSIDKVSDTILWVDENGQFIDANEGACQNLGYDYEALITKGVADIDPYFPQERWPSHWEEMTQCGKMIIESVHQTKNGNRYPVEIILHNQKFQDKRYNCVFCA